MNFMICIQRRGKAKVIGKCNILGAMVLITAACDSIAEKISKERKIEKNDAMKFVTDLILQSCTTLN